MQRHGAGEPQGESHADVPLAGQRSRPKNSQRQEGTVGRRGWSLVPFRSSKEPGNFWQRKGSGDKILGTGWWNREAKRGPDPDHLFLPALP